MKPCKTYLKLKEIEQQSQGGIFLPSVKSGVVNEAEFVEAGSEVSLSIEPKARVLFLTKDAVEHSESGVKYWFVQESNIIAIQ